MLTTPSWFVALAHGRIIDALLASLRPLINNISTFSGLQITMHFRHVESIEDAFSPIFGKMAWAVKRGYGTFLTMEFGSPHLVVREPIVASPGACLATKQALAQRRATIVGDWHFWIQYALWEIHTVSYPVRNQDSEATLIDEVLKELNGQILLSAACGTVPNSCLLNFDLGASLHISPSPGFENDEQWTLREQDEVVAYTGNGDLSVSSAFT